MTASWTAGSGSARKTALLYGHGLGQKLKASALMPSCQEADTRRFKVTVSATGGGWHIAPAVLAQSSKDRYVKGDSYEWLRPNTRLIKEVTQNFASGRLRAAISTWI